VGAKRSKIRFITATVYCDEAHLNDFYFLNATLREPVCTFQYATRSSPISSLDVKKTLHGIVL